mgnify:CR=1 FL=1
MTDQHSARPDTPDAQRHGLDTVDHAYESLEGELIEVPYAPRPAEVIRTRQGVIEARDTGVQPGAPVRIRIEEAGGAMLRLRVIDQGPGLGKWRPGNYTNKFKGPVTLTTALKDSINTVAVQLTNEVDDEQYLRGRGEMPASWPAAALQAQAMSLLVFTGASLAWDTDAHASSSGALRRSMDAGSCARKRRRSQPRPRRHRRARCEPRHPHGCSRAGS